MRLNAGGVVATIADLPGRLLGFASRGVAGSTVALATVSPRIQSPAVGRAGAVLLRPSDPPTPRMNPVIDPASMSGACALAPADPFRLLVESVHDRVAFVDADGRIASWNGGAEALLGYSAMKSSAAG